MEKSFGLLKPDCLRRGIEQEVLNHISTSGLQIINQKRVRLTEEQVCIIWPTYIFGTSAMENVIHSSSNEVTYNIESNLFFKEEVERCKEYENQ